MPSGECAAKRRRFFVQRVIGQSTDCKEHAPRTHWAHALRSRCSAQTHSAQTTGGASPPAICSIPSSGHPNRAPRRLQSGQKGHGSRKLQPVPAAHLQQHVAGERRLAGNVRAVRRLAAGAQLGQRPVRRLQGGDLPHEEDRAPGLQALPAREQLARAGASTCSAWCVTIQGPCVLRTRATYTPR